jgi:hypothetical protein
MCVILCYLDEEKQRFVFFNHSYFGNGFPNAIRENMLTTECHWWKSNKDFAISTKECRVLYWKIISLCYLVFVFDSLTNKLNENSLWQAYFFFAAILSLLLDPSHYANV